MTTFPSAPRFSMSREGLPAVSASGGPLVRVAVCLGVLALLSACSGGQHLSASQEASSYRNSARGSYTAPGGSGDPWGPYIQEASERYDIPDRWIREVMRVESGGRTEMGGRPITSGAGAMGLMQVMPGTYDELRGRYGLGPDPYDPHNSILAGTAYIRELYDLYGSPGFLAAYNGGPGRLDDFLTRNRPLPDETRRYVAKIGPYITDTFPHKRSTAEQFAMNAMPTSIPAGPRYPDATPIEVASAPVYRTPVREQPSAPVEVAYAPPAADESSFDPPPGWTPRAMGRSVVAAYVPPPTTIPEPAPMPVAAAPSLVFEPAPVPSQSVTREPAQRSLPRAQFAAAAPLPVPTPPMPLPPPYTPSVQTAYAPQTLHRETGFRLVQSANAAPAPLYRGGAGQWAIQVGAFGNEGLARIAVGNAREQAAAPLASARPAVEGVREPHGTLYRARLVGLSRDAAAQACDRLRSRTSCIVLSPEAQN